MICPVFCLRVEICRWCQTAAECHACNGVVQHVGMPVLLTKRTLAESRHRPLLHVLRLLDCIQVLLCGSRLSLHLLSSLLLGGKHFERLGWRSMTVTAKHTGFSYDMMRRTIARAVVSHAQLATTPASILPGVMVMCCMHI